MLYNYILIIAGLLSSLILFNRFPIIRSKSKDKTETKEKPNIKLSIVIPARNEEKNIALLLEDLKEQTIEIHEIICVNDGSTDKTQEVIEGSGAKLLNIKNKPKDWMGKAWACQSGGKAATGDLILPHIFHLLYWCVFYIGN